MSPLRARISTTLNGATNSVRHSLVVDESAVLHRSVAQEDVDRQPFLERRVPTPRHRLQPVHEIDLVRILRKKKRVPCNLRRRDVHFRIQREETRFRLHH